MNDIIGYIFSRLNSSKTDIRHMQKNIRQQARINKAVMILSVVMSIYIIAGDIYNREQDLRIEKLTNDIKELKRTEGE